MAFAKFYNKSYLLVFYEDMGLMTFFLTECKKSYYEYVESVFVSIQWKCSVGILLGILHVIYYTNTQIHSPATLLGTPVQLLGNTNC